MVSVEEWNLLSFFNTMPTPLDPDVPWPYNDFLFQVEQEDMALSFSIAPAYKDIRLLLMLRGQKIFEVNAVGVDDVRYHKRNGCESLEVVLTDQVALWLRLSPRIQIDQTMSGGL
ncbi:MAG: hypothetical protein K0R39_686 [Symbiobacteriaceae bacterium]|nr:hypothetical protein [Symbiobacteriaceae bacterium]